jgi:hypothetical protein
VRQITRKDAKASIERLFKTLWPLMEGAGERFGDCLGHLDSIHAIVARRQTQDARLAQLIRLHGIKATIASGLLWSFFPSECVPFDRHTMGYCVMDWRVIPDPVITNGTYAKKCSMIIARLATHVPALPAVVDLVRWAASHRTLEVAPQ